jgi:3-oxoacyl-(acyl-carrier-protein) synthase
VDRIVVTGMGVVTAIGENLAMNHRALKLGTCGIATLGLFPSKFAGVLPCGEVQTSTEALKKKLHANQSGVTRTSLLALQAFQEAIADSGLDASEISAPDTALVNATTVGGMCLTDDLYHDANEPAQGSEFLGSYDYGSVAIYLQRVHQMRGIINTINTACSSSANSIGFGARLIQNGLARRVIVGGVDSLAKFTINGFHALHILSAEVCRPFDQDRQGLNLGEGAAFLVLERSGDRKNKKVYAAFSGYGNSNDAFHPSSLSEQGDGPFLAMKEALDSGGLTPGDIGFINAHGTATENNDLVESRAMLRLFGRPPAFSSTKSNIGHTLGAAGAIEAVYSILSLVHQEVYPTLHFKNAISAEGLKPVGSYSNMPLEHVMSNSFGFGGNCSSLIFSNP